MAMDALAAPLPAVPPDMTAEPADAVDAFLRLSAALTGFDRMELLGTGMVRRHYDELTRIIGARQVGTLLAAASRVESDHPASGEDFDRAFRERILDDNRFGPVARRIVRMWYVGSWAQLPREWRNTYGATSLDMDHVVSAAAYREGLAWVAAGAHPMGAKQQGFGAWARPSRLRPGTGAATGTATAVEADR
jgi:hypothetical protein